MVDTHVKRIGDKLGRTRESMGYTLQQLADIASVAPSTIQKIEAGTMSPSIAVMMKISRGLRKKISFFLDEEESDTEVSFVRKDERLSIGEREDTITIQKLTAELINPEMDAYVLILPPGSNSGDEALRHHGEELVYCIKGRITFTIDDEHYTLGPGDSLHFKSKLLHFYKNSGRSSTEIIIICSVPILAETIDILKSADRTENEKRSPSKWVI